MRPLPPLLAARTADLRQAARVTIASALTYAAYKLLGLPQGYWAVFTVVIVMQGSIANTLGAAADRLAGTIAGALIGGIAAVALQHGEVSTGVALTGVIGIAAFAASVRPQLKAAPITAAIMLLTQPAGTSTETFVIHRILEIALGGFIGVATSVLVFPARSDALVIGRAASVLERIRDLLTIQAGGLERHEALTFSAGHAALRRAVAAVEQAMGDAERERSSHLADHAIPSAIPRTLWRARNDVVLIARALDQPLPGVVAEVLDAPAAALLRSEAAYAGRCAEALRTGAAAPRGDEAALFDAFEAAFDRLRKAGLIRPLEFAEAGRVFGLAFALEALHRDLGDLGERIGEIAAGGTP